MASAGCSYVAPSEYIIGGQTLAEPLVIVSALKAHLALLYALKQLRDAIEDGTDNRIPQFARFLEPAQRWSWFVHLAVERFATWVLDSPVDRLSIEDWIQQELPPLDVLMVWHAYTLNPMWYSEDLNRLEKFLKPLNLNDYLLEALMRMGNVSSYEPSEQSKATWISRCYTPYDPLDAVAVMREHIVMCPHCFNSNAAPFLTANGTGYAQKDFKLQCNNCNFVITKETLAALKFAHDMALDYRNEDDILEYGNAVYLAGTLHTTTCRADQDRGKAVKNSLLRSAHLAMPYGLHTKQEWIRLFSRQLKHSMRKLTRIATMTTVEIQKTKMVLQAYADDRPFSVDLVGAVIRQCSFIDKMHHLKWTTPGFFNSKEDEIVLVHAIARYHAFLDLMAVDPEGFFVPTLDIDLAWHTHQMVNVLYSRDCKQYVGRYVDHDDTVIESTLAMSYDTTCQIWEKRFQVPYSYCGCPLPGSTMGQRLSHLQNRLGLRDITMSQDALVPPRREDVMMATHASDHNCAIAVQRNAYSVRKTRADEINERRQRDVKNAKKGKIDEAIVQRGLNHDAAFLCPVPFTEWQPAADCLSVSNPHKAMITQQQQRTAQSSS